MRTRIMMSASSHLPSSSLVTSYKNNLYNSVGSIDENALSSLSLVINLTKHIQLKAQGISQEDIDPEEYA